VDDALKELLEVIAQLRARWDPDDENVRDLWAAADKLAEAMKAQAR
jgi:hypothetical protein